MNHNWIEDNGNSSPPFTQICVEIKHCNPELKLNNKQLFGEFKDDGFYLTDGGELSFDWNIIRWRLI